MKIDLRAKGMELTAETRDHVNRRLWFALSRFGDEVMQVRVRLEDVNGPRGGVDKRCRLIVRGRRMGEKLVVGEGGTVEAAIDVACDALGFSVGRALARARRWAVA